MAHPATKDDIVGKTVARILQTEWERSESFSSCEFFVELADGTLIGLGFDSLSRVDGDRSTSRRLRDADIDTEFPALYTSDGYTGVGATIERVLVDTYDSVYLLLSGQYYLTFELEEGQTALCVYDHKEFLYHARIFEFFDYWTREPCIFDNMRAIDVLVESSVTDLDLWQSRELFLTIGRLRDGVVSDLRAVPNSANRNGWKARFVVPELGTYRVIVQRGQGDFVTDVHIDETVIDRGHLEVRVV